MKNRQIARPKYIFTLIFLSSNFIAAIAAQFLPDELGFLDSEHGFEDSQEKKIYSDGDTCEQQDFKSKKSIISQITSDGSMSDRKAGINKKVLDKLEIKHNIINDGTDNDDDIDDGNKNDKERIEFQNKICVDYHERCRVWASDGECEANPNYMNQKFERSCGSCKLEQLDLGVTQRTDRHETEVLDIVELSHQYIYDKVLRERKLRSIIHSCKNQHELCAFWAVLGECDTNPNYMKKKCSLVCQSCNQHLISTRCSLDPNAKKALEPGDLNKMFERITDVSEGSEYAKYEPVVHSRPNYLPDDNEKNSTELDYKIGPWVVTFESFLTHEECDRLVEMGAKMGYSRSMGVGKRKADGKRTKNVIEGRTSETSWCNNECNNDHLVSNITKQIVNLTGVPEVNQEPLQLLKYEVGQFYKNHKDYINAHVDRQCGPRILTIFLYLNNVEEGGGTRFNDLDITLEPKKGKALIWPNVLDSDPMAMEPKSYHEAMPVLKGIKHGANSWIHLYNYKKPAKKHCIY